MTRRKVLEHWTEVKQIDDRGEVKATTCCCAAPGGTRKGCAIVQGNRTPCRCWCHTRESMETVRERRAKKGTR